MGNGSGVTGLILSIIGLVVAIIAPIFLNVLLIGFIGNAMIVNLLWLILPAIGVILSIVGIATNDSKAPGIVGLIFGIAGVLVAVFGIVFGDLISYILSMFTPTYF